MIDDLKIIKKNYGEAMAHFCREEFPTILEQPSALSNILLSHFNPTKFLYNDICEQDKVDEFKNYIYNIFDSGIRELKEDKEIPTPKELLDKAGYTLYECHSEEDIQAFRKYYKPNEELCTFRDERLKKYYVFFAVKKNVSEIIRENFPKPERQDEYGTSVISVQFSRNESHILSIKNRYNHHVAHPDATFSNNLDNIIEGLTESFAIHYGLVQQYVNKFHLDGYVLANDGKYYKYNYEIDTIYYCPDNIIIVNGVVIPFAKEKFIVMDYFVLNLVTKEIFVYDDIGVSDSFPNSIGEIKKITIQKEDINKRIILTPKEGEDITIVLDSMNCIIEYQNSNTTKVENYFLRYVEHLVRIELSNIVTIGDAFCNNAATIEEVILPNVEEIGDFFLHNAESLRTILIFKVKIIGDNFCYYNERLENIECPYLTIVGSYFLRFNKILKRFYAPFLKQVGLYFCNKNNAMEIIEFPSLEIIENNFFEENRVATELIIPNVQHIQDSFLLANTNLENIDVSNSPKNVRKLFQRFNPNALVRVRKKEE